MYIHPLYNLDIFSFNRYQQSDGPVRNFTNKDNIFMFSLLTNKTTKTDSTTNLEINPTLFTGSLESYLES